jgi:hypothetical protein
MRNEAWTRREFLAAAGGGAAAVFGLASAGDNQAPVSAAKRPCGRCWLSITGHQLDREMLELLRSG